MRVLDHSCDEPLAPPPSSEPLHYRFMVSVARRVPLDVATATGEVLADVARRIWRRKRSAAQRNYATVLGVRPNDPQAAELSRRAFRNYGRYIAEMFHLQALRTEDLPALLTFRNLRNVEQALSLNRGVILVSAHIGNMEAASAAFAVFGRSVLAAAERIRPRWMMRYMEHARAKWGITLVPADRAGRRLLHALRRNEMVVLIADVGVRGASGVRVRFFGRDTYFPSGPARLARLSGAPIVFCYGLRRPKAGYDIVIGQPVLPVRSDNEERDLSAMMQQLVDQMEALIRRRPDQWYMFRDMWPRRPLPARVEPVAAPVMTGAAAS